MRQTACAWRFLPAIIGGGTWEGAPMPGMRRREFVSAARRCGGRVAVGGDRAAADDAGDWLS